MITNSISQIKKYTTAFLVICIFAECIFFPSFENFLGCIAQLYGWLLISLTVLKRKYLYRYFVPFVTLFCLAFYFFVFPLPVTLLEGKPLTFRFSVPYLTFFNLMLNVTTIVLAFHTCRWIYREGWLTAVWRKLGFFTPPTERQIWTLGILGFLALLWNISIQGTEMQEAENKGIIGQFLNVFRFYAYAPLALLFVKYWGREVILDKKKVLIYLLVLSIVAIASTRRTILMNMAISWVVMSFFIILIENKKLFSTKRILFLLFGFYLITGPVADLALAMIINRHTSYQTDASSTFNRVLDLYSDKEKLHKVYQMGTFANTDNEGDNYSAWSEYYIDNIFFDRFCNLRTQDITLDYAQKLGYDSPRMQEYARSFLIFQVPTPILNFWGYTGNKFENMYTPGDLLSTDALRLKYQYKGFRVSGDSAVGLAWMGYKYYIFAFLLYVCLFYFFTSLVSLKKGFIIPIPIIIGMTFYMSYFNNATGIFRTISLLVRTGWQDILIYCIAMWGIKKIVR